MISLLIASELNCVKTAISTTNILSNLNTLTNIFVNILVIAGSIMGFNYICKLREKQKDSAFNYLTRLNIRARYLYNLLIKYSDEISDYFLPTENRRELPPDKITIVSNVIKCVSQNAKETLFFLMNEENQMPAQRGWVKCINAFVEFLIRLEQIENDSIFKLVDNEEHNKYSENVKNINTLITMINKQQENIEKDIFEVTPHIDCGADAPTDSTSDAK